MRKISRPNCSVEETYLLCISKVQNQQTKQSLESIKDKIIESSNNFEQACLNQEVHYLVARNDINKILKLELQKTYKSRMVKKNQPGRATYDKIMLYSPEDKCPFCAQRTVSQLDHFLPKAHYPELSVTPINLVPICGDCNKLKLDEVPSTAETVGSHPYFDDFDGEQWLFARIENTRPIVISFFPNPPDTWDAIKSERIKNHFHRLNLSQLYTTHAAEKICNIENQNKILFECGGAQLLKDNLLSSAVSRQKHRINSWQTALYQALANNNSYCNGNLWSYS